MKPFDYVAAHDSRHAVALLGQYGDGARILAGGTDLLVELKSAPVPPQVVIDISRAADLKAIEVTDEGVRIGALVTHAEIMRSLLIRQFIPAMAAAARSIGATQTRNLGTLGGNLVSCVPSMDSGPVLVALDAVAELLGPAGERRISLRDLFVAPRRTSLRAGELLTAVIIPGPNVGKPAAFEKFGLRRGQALALVNVGASVWVDYNRAAFVAPAIALGAVAPTVIRAPLAEAYLAGRALSAEAMAEAGRFAAEEAKPISDFRASAGYRRDLIAVLVKRALARACGAGAVQAEERAA
jgi:aerobic carbon-monoxide dehydrogenase medium subunit